MSVVKHRLFFYMRLFSICLHFVIFSFEPFKAFVQPVLQILDFILIATPDVVVWGSVFVERSPFVVVLLHGKPEISGLFVDFTHDVILVALLTCSARCFLPLPLTFT